MKFFTAILCFLISGAHAGYDANFTGQVTPEAAQLLKTVTSLKEDKCCTVEGIWACVEVPKLGSSATNGVEAIVSGW